jgi:hypothetical protein
MKTCFIHCAVRLLSFSKHMTFRKSGVILMPSSIDVGLLNIILVHTRPTLTHIIEYASSAKKSPVCGLV